MTRYGARILSLAFFAAVSATQTAACMFHSVLPEKTLSQLIATSPSLIVARPSDSDPFRFAVSQTLRGAPPEVAPPHLVDAVTRRRLAVSPDEAVLFVRDSRGDWTRLLLLDGHTFPVVTRMLAEAETWASPEGAAARRDFAASLLAHPDTRLQRIALRELDSLDYATLRGGTYTIDSAVLIAGLRELQEQAYVPVRILLLGIIGGEAAARQSKRQLDRLHASGTVLNLGAWTTAAIELRGADAIAELHRAVSLSPRPAKAGAVAEIVQALAVQSAAGDPALRGPISDILLQLATHYPTAASLIPNALLAAGDQHQTELVRALVASRAFATREEVISAYAYLSRAFVAGDAAGASPAFNRFQPAKPVKD